LEIRLTDRLNARKGKAAGTAGGYQKTGIAGFRNRRVEPNQAGYYMANWTARRPSNPAGADNLCAAQSPKQKRATVAGRPLPSILPKLWSGPDLLSGASKS
jgi:hypothetical protein